MVTINPNYMMKGQANPYYDLDQSIYNKIKTKLNKDYLIDIKNHKYFPLAIVGIVVLVVFKITVTGVCNKSVSMSA